MFKITTKTIKGVTQGLINSIFIKQEVERVAEERNNICLACEFHSDKNETIRPDTHCTKCGCNLHIKQRAMGYGCEEGKWHPVTDEKTSDAISSIIENESNELTKDNNNLLV